MYRSYLHKITSEVDRALLNRPAEPERWNHFKGLTVERAASFYLHSYISAITQAHCGHDLLWSGNVSISFGSLEQTLYGTLKRRSMSYLDSRNIFLLLFQKVADAIEFLSPPLYQCNVPHLDVGGRLSWISVCVCVCTCGTAPWFTGECRCCCLLPLASYSNISTLSFSWVHGVEREICQSRAGWICSYLKLCYSSTGSSHSV